MDHRLQATDEVLSNVNEREKFEEQFSEDVISLYY